jgi:hypothetical protein
MKKIRHLPPVDDRVETGPVQFGDDWPGVFIRGDNAMVYAMALSSLIKQDGDPISELVVEGLMNTLMSSRIWQGPPQNDLNTCPNCGGPADNGHDRSHPPAPYFCTKCTESR